MVKQMMFKTKVPFVCEGNGVWRWASSHYLRLDELWGEKKLIHEGNDLMNQRVAEKGCAPSFLLRIPQIELLSMDQDQRGREVE